MYTFSTQVVPKEVVEEIAKDVTREIDILLNIDDGRRAYIREVMMQAIVKVVKQ